MASTRRDHLVDTALKLFARGGFHATGIDTILAEAGVAKMTLYNHFRSKEELILAVLRRRDELFRNWFVKRVEQQADQPRQRLIAMFDVLGLTDAINEIAVFPDALVMKDAMDSSEITRIQLNTPEFQK